MKVCTCNYVRYRSSRCELCSTKEKPINIKNNIHDSNIKMLTTLPELCNVNEINILSRRDYHGDYINLLTIYNSMIINELALIGYFSSNAIIEFSMKQEDIPPIKLSYVDSVSQLQESLEILNEEERKIIFDNSEYFKYNTTNIYIKQNEADEYIFKINSLEYMKFIFSNDPDIKIKVEYNHRGGLYEPKLFKPEREEFVKNTLSNFIQQLNQIMDNKGRYHV